MVTADLVFELAVVLSLAALLTIPRLMAGKMEVGARRERIICHKRRRAHVRPTHRHPLLQQARHAT